jgi:hypothetical protein
MSSDMDKMTIILSADWSPKIFLREPRCKASITEMKTNWKRTSVSIPSVFVIP